MSAATPLPPPPLAQAQALSPSYHPFGAHQPPRWTSPYVPRSTREPPPLLTVLGTPLKKKCKSFVPFTFNFPLMHAPHHLTKKNLAPQGHLDKFFFFFFFFLLIWYRCRTMALTTSLPSPPLMCTKATPACSPPHHLWHTSESATTWPRHPRNSLTLSVTPQPALSCDVCDVFGFGVKSYQDFSTVMNKIVGAKLNQI